MVWATRIGGLVLGDATDTKFHKDGFGHWGIIIRGDGAIVLNDSKVFDFYEFHGFMMWAAWGIFGLVQLASNRYFKVYWRYAMWVHRITGTLTLLITWVVAMLAIRRGGWEIEIGVHQVMGVIILSLVTLLAAGGIFNRSRMQRLRWNTKQLLQVKMGHRWFGYFMLLLSEIQILTGSLKYAQYQGETVNLPGLIHIFLFVIFVILIEGIYQKHKRGEVQFNGPRESNEVMITREEFASRVQGGEQLVILDDLVLDLSKFKFEHPGGKFLMEHNIGRDVSKYFYGGYVLEYSQGLKPVRHSNVARNIVNQLIIGRLNEKASIFSVRVSATQVINHFSKTFILRAEGGNQAWRAPASTDVSSFGRHYLLRSYSNSKIRRHYTVAASMRRDANDQYQGLIKQFREDPSRKTYNFDETVLPEYQEAPEVVFVCKNYNVQGGLSYRLHTSQNDLCQIKGIMGKGLGINETAEGAGTHIGFVAGTGVLIFVDFLALLLRANLGLLENPEVVSPIFTAKSKFKLILYVAFESRKDSLALDLLEGLYEITQKKGLKNFDLVVRLSSEKPGGKWDEDFVKRQFKIHKCPETTITKVWVCGPPAMNEVFDRCFDRMREQGELPLPLSSIEIM